MCYLISEEYNPEDTAPNMTNPQLNCYETISNYSSQAPSTTQDAPHLHHYNSEHQPSTATSMEHEGAPPPPLLHHNKFKHTILQRYLNDSFEHAQRYQKAESNRRRNGSGAGSVGSHEYEDVSAAMSARLSPHSLQSNEAGQSAFTFEGRCPVHI